MCDIASCYENISGLRNAQFILQNYGKNVKNWKNSYGFWKIDKFISNEKRIGHQFVTYFLLLLLCKINICDIFNMVGFFF